MWFSPYVFNLTYSLTDFDPVRLAAVIDLLPLFCGIYARSTRPV